MGVLKDLLNQRFGRWTIISKSNEKSSSARWECRCDCGTRKTVGSQSLLNGQSKSCGCYMREIAILNGKRVGSLPKNRKNYREQHPQEYQAWQNMKARCKQKKLRCYKNYGGRGITYSQKWESFVNFLEDMGKAPSPKHSLDRIDNNGNYEANNCRWATKSEQSFNTSKNVYIEHDGKRMTITQWSVFLGGAPQLIRTRLTKGWSLERAISTPVQKDRT